MKETLGKILRIFTTVLMVLSICMMIFTVISVLTFNRSDRQLFGYRAFIVLSDSMSATDFKAGDLVLTRDVDPATLQPGDIIAFTSTNDENYGQTVTHKIRSLTWTCWASTPDIWPAWASSSTSSKPRPATYSASSSPSPC